MKHSLTINAIYCPSLCEYMKDATTATLKSIEEVIDGSIAPTELSGCINSELMSDSEIAEIIGSNDSSKIEEYKDEHLDIDFESDFEAQTIEFFFDVPEAKELELFQEYRDVKANFEKNRDAYYGYCRGNHREFAKVYGDGNGLSYDQWLFDSGAYKITDYKVTFH